MFLCACTCEWVDANNGEKYKVSPFYLICSEKRFIWTTSGEQIDSEKAVTFLSPDLTLRSSNSLLHFITARNSFMNLQLYSYVIIFDTYMYVT